MSRIELHWPNLHGLLAMAGHNAVAGLVNDTHRPQPVCVWVKTATPVGLGSLGMQGTDACETKVATPVGLGSPGMPGTEASQLTYQDGRPLWSRWELKWD